MLMSPDLIKKTNKEKSMKTFSPSIPSLAAVYKLKPNRTSRIRREQTES